MNVLNLSDCESVLLLYLIAQLLFDLDINPKTGKHKLPPYSTVDLKGVDIKVLRSLQTKLDTYFG